MYTGVKLNIRVDSYEDARRALGHCARRSKVKAAEVLVPGGISAGLGHKRAEVTRVRLLKDESIAFRLYNTDVVVWHPDNRVSIDSYPSVTTGAFANALLPRGLYMGGVSQLMTYYPTCSADAHWRERWDAAHVCRADGTYYNDENGAWVPDETTLNTMPVLTLDRKIAREASREHHLAQFKLWLPAACAVADLEYESCNYLICIEALRAHDFRTAAAHLPALTLTNGFGMRDRIKRLEMRNVRYDEPITLGSVERVRTRIYDDAGAWSEERVLTMATRDYERQQTLMRRRNAAGVY